MKRIIVVLLTICIVCNLLAINTIYADDTNPAGDEVTDVENPEENSENPIEDQNGDSTNDSEDQNNDQDEDPVRAVTNLITYDSDTNKYFYDGAEHDDFPTAGEYVLGSNIIISNTIEIAGTLTIDFGGYTISDKYEGNRWLFSVQQGDILTFKGTGNLKYESNTHHTAIYINNGGQFTMTDNTVIEDYITDSNGAAISINHKNDIATMSGNATVRNCSTTVSTGGGGVNVFIGKFYMLDNATVTDCHNIFSNGAEKQGNGAGVQVGKKASFYLRDNASITNCSGTGYHGAGVDLWSDSFLYISGSPTVTGNLNGKGYPCNLYCGCPIHVDGLMTGAENSIGISIQNDPIFTRGLSENNPNTSVDELIKIFSSDRHEWLDLPRHEEYTVVNHNDIEAKQAPVIIVHFMYNYGDLEEYVDQQVVPGGYATKPTPDPRRNGYNFNGWYRTAATTGSAWSFGSTNVPIDNDLYLYAKWSPKQYTVTIQLAGETGHVTASETATAYYDEIYTVSAVADSMYAITSVKIDNTEMLNANVDDYLYDLTVSKNHTVVITVAKIEASVTVNITENGNEDKITLTTLNPQIVNIGDNATIEYTLEDGYYIEKVTIDGEEVSDFNGTIENVTTDTIVEFTVGKMYFIDIGYQGYTEQINIEPSRFVLPNSNASFTFTTNEGYYITEVYVNDQYYALDYGQRTFEVNLTNIESDQMITVKVDKVIIVPDPTGLDTNITAIIIVTILVAGCLIITKGNKCSKIFRNR